MLRSGSNDARKAACHNAAMVQTSRSFIHVGTLVGDHARAAMLLTLMDGRAHTASELAGVAGISPQTASSHLRRLLDGGILAEHHALQIGVQSLQLGDAFAGADVDREGISVGVHAQDAGQ